MMSIKNDTTNSSGKVTSRKITKRRCTNTQSSKFKNSSKLFNKRYQKRQRSKHHDYITEVTKHVVNQDSDGTYIMMRQQPLLSSLRGGLTGETMILPVSQVSSLIQCLQNVANAHAGVKLEQSMDDIDKCETQQATIELSQFQEEQRPNQNGFSYVDGLLMGNEVHNVYSEEMVNTYAQMMMKNFNEIVQKNCNGCISHESNPHSHNLCLLASNEEKVSVCFDELLCLVDEVEANELCFMTTSPKCLLPANSKDLYLSLDILKSNHDWLMQTRNKLLQKLIVQRT